MFKSETVNPVDSGGSEALIEMVCTREQSMQSTNYLKERGQ